MTIERCKMQQFTVIGKQGSTLDGEGFIKALWQEANSHFEEIEHLAKRDRNGICSGFWGAMSDMSLSFAPWEDGFSKGLYLAGCECVDDAQAPEGWTKWVIPAYEYIYCETKENTFAEMLKYLSEQNFCLAGAVHDYICPETGKGYMFFPINKL